MRYNRRKDTADHHGLPRPLAHRCRSKPRQTSGTPQAAARASPQARPVTGRPPSRPPSAPAWERPSSRRSSLEPSKIIVKSASCARVLRMALRATLDCDLPRHMMAPIGRTARNRLPHHSARSTVGSLSPLRSYARIGL
jgi:hypothetical protein